MTSDIGEAIAGLTADELREASIPGLPDADRELLARELQRADLDAGDRPDVREARLKAKLRERGLRLLPSRFTEHDLACYAGPDEPYIITDGTFGRGFVTLDEAEVFAESGSL